MGPTTSVSEHASEHTRWHGRLRAFAVQCWETTQRQLIPPATNGSGASFVVTAIYGNCASAIAAKSGTAAAQHWQRGR